ncbi:hypothetical protein pEaSNUABM30_00057 [Erwinia phage pEa_SNUABM_30]|uniref:Uncharacterized protein n=1 Tax=Erwinia phage pEa_SNUABM_30 TaxID=2869553 RepID=A0AAE9BS52_9CAUD|nr:hypothetical protein MPK69_gp057 [Erwinia phage pEa_SNUABM_30]UAW53175.1 hypothetical protein pEaSNUABM30_00057 [Erwinia phage pEa_SNUABM_30]
MRPILVVHGGKVLPAQLVNEDRKDVYFVRHMTIRGQNVYVAGLAPVATVVFLYGYSPTVDDYEVVKQMRGK